jgi:hypothetical protein
MSEQNQVIVTVNRESRLPGVDAFKKSISTKGLSHGVQHTKSFHFSQNPTVEKTTTVERYQRSYKVVFDFCKSDNEVTLCSIDGNHDIDDTYNDDFIDAMIDGAKESLISECSNESENDLYNGD